MPRRLSIALIFLLMLAACTGGGDQSPTLAPTLPPQAETTPEEPTLEPIPASDVQLTLAAPIPGTLVVAAPTVGEPTIVLEFTDLTFTRSGGLVGQPITVVVNADGSILRNGTASTITPDQVEAIRSRLDRINFFQLQGIFTSAGNSADIFTYSITVNGNMGSRTIFAQDGLIPPELIDLFTLLAELGVSAAPATQAPPTARPTDTPVPTPSL